jgi:hypothetical protein
MSLTTGVIGVAPTGIPVLSKEMVGIAALAFGAHSR